MAVKILGGVAKGHSLQIPRSESFRPTSVRLKRKLFDYRQNWEGYTFIDLCAGSGAMGLEAWSRGAKDVILVEKNRKTFQLLQKNYLKLQEKYQKYAKETSIELVSASASQWAKTSLERHLENYQNIVLFFDPPYRDHDLYKQTFSTIKNLGSRYQFECWIESDKNLGIHYDQWLEIGGDPDKYYVQGTSFFILYSFD